MDSGETSIEGVIERIVYFNDDTCYCIAVMKPTLRAGKKENITITGVMPAVQCGETVLVKGTWSRHPQYGAQIKVNCVSGQSALIADGREIETISAGAQIEVEMPSVALKFARLSGDSYFGVLRNKLGWAEDPRRLQNEQR